MRLKYIDGLMGFVVGDAMGVPLEFKSRNELLEQPVTKMTGFGTHNQPEGTWSDDTSMLIATIDSINAKNKIDYSYQNRLVDIYRLMQEQKFNSAIYELNDLIDNNYRIGFHLYELEKTNKIKDINKIVDENTNYLKRLNIINEKVEKEINKLINR